MLVSCFDLVLEVVFRAVDTDRMHPVSDSPFRDVTLCLVCGIDCQPAACGRRCAAVKEEKGSSIFSSQ